MTTPNTDTPVASVPYGPSEIVSFLLMIGSFCNATLGQDYGISKNAQAISALVAGLIPIGVGLFRAIKHHGAMTANAVVIAKQIEATAVNVQTARHAASPTATSIPSTITIAPPVSADLPASSDL
jgi:hypothetical protein